MKTSSWRIAVSVVCMWLSACVGPNRQQPDEAVAAADQSQRDSVSIDELIARGDSAYRYWIPRIKGDWVAQDYVEELLRTKSAYKAARYCGGATTLVIDTMRTMYDTVNRRAFVYAHTGWNNHEGYSFLIDLATKSKNSLQLFHSQLEKERYGELFLLINNRDTLLKVISHEEGVEDQRIYQKLMRASKEYDLGLSHVPAQLLMQSNYKFVEPSNLQSIVVLRPDGSVNGFLEYTNYGIRTDFTGPFYSDYIGFGQGGDFVWQFSGDTLKLYDFIEYQGGAQTNQGPLRYKLLRLNR